MIALYAHIGRLQTRIEGHESAFCGIIDALQRGDHHAALLIATKELTTPPAPASFRAMTQTVGGAETLTA